MNSEARRFLTGPAERGGVGEAVRRGGAYGLFALCALAAIHQLQVVAVLALGPEIGSTLGAGAGTFSFAVAAHAVGLHLGMLRFATIAESQPIRAAITARSAVIWSFLTLVTSFASSGSAVIAAMFAAGFARGSVKALHLPLLMDTYDVRIRGRLFGMWTAAEASAIPIAAAVVGVAWSTGGASWRGVLVVCGVVSLGVVATAERLRDPGFGAPDHALLRAAVDGGADGPAIGEETILGAAEVRRRLTLMPSFRALLLAYGLLGVFLIPFNAFMLAYLDRRFGLILVGRVVALGLMWIPAIGAALAAGRWLDREAPGDVGRPIAMAAKAVAVAGAAIAVGALVAVRPITFALFSVGLASIAVVFPLVQLPLLTIIQPRQRPQALAILHTTMTLAGGLGGLVILGGVDRRIGIAGALATLIVPALLASRALSKAAPLVESDLDNLLLDVAEDERLKRHRAAGERIPLLRCQGINFAYDQVQVLFDVDFTVDDGEMVALLGTNGAGKSTLLRVISGLGLPSRGSLHFRGEEITYLDAERRVEAGVVQIPGGRAVFPPLSVLENLRVYGFAFDRDKKAVERGIEATFGALPRLYERRNQPAATLSGGEQQMLALAKAFILRPRLLLIDELSLGLAPVIVGELLEMVRRINASGTAVVLVEQSVNVALSVVDHAYFMERGQIRFDGKASDLLGRPDLLRSVFLEGAQAGRAQARAGA